MNNVQFKIRYRENSCFQSRDLKEWSNGKAWLHICFCDWLRKSHLSWTYFWAVITSEILLCISSLESLLCCSHPQYLKMMVWTSNWVIETCSLRYTIWRHSFQHDAYLSLIVLPYLPHTEMLFNPTRPTNSWWLSQPLSLLRLDYLFSDFLTLWPNFQPVLIYQLYNTQEFRGFCRDLWLNIQVSLPFLSLQDISGQVLCSDTLWCFNLIKHTAEEFPCGQVNLINLLASKWQMLFKSLYLQKT